MRRSLLGAAIAVTLAGAAALGGAPPALAADTGGIAGHLTDHAGQPVADVPVYVYEDDPWEIVGWALTGADGGYAVDSLPPGTYLIGFEPAGRPSQYYDNASASHDADLVTVTAGQTTTVDEDLTAVGWITGRLVRADGTPLAYKPVNASTADGSGSGWASTDEDGRYRMGVLPGTYTVSFQAIESSSQYQHIPGRLTDTGATTFTVATGEEVVADDTLLPTGSLTGRLTTADGAPVETAWVEATVGDRSVGVWSATDADGEFAIPEVLTGEYRLSFSAGERLQWYDGAIRLQDADPVVVTAGGQTRIVESWVGTGTVAVSAVDSVTGAPVARFCARDTCTTTGTVTLTDLPAGVHEIGLSTEDGSYFDRSVDVQARADRTTSVTVKLRPAGRITVEVVDRQTGAPVEGVCAAAFKPKRVTLPDGYGDCTDAQGRMSIGRLTAGTYTLFVDPFDAPSYGRQWVGAGGGTGDERQAAPIAVTVGAAATAPRVLLDRAGSISGQVTSAATGQPVVAGITLMATGFSGNSDVSTDDEGRFTMDRLGPYAWPLLFGSQAHPAQWSGNQPSRYTATPVTVTSGGTTAYDIALQPGIEVRGTVTLDGTAPEWGRLIARSADTGDRTGTDDFAAGEPYSMRVMGDQKVTFEAFLSTGGEESLHLTRVPLPPATPGGPVRYAVRLPATGTYPLDIAVTTPG